MNADLVLVCGDLNARTGDKLDYISDVDTIPIRKSLETTYNKHGELLIEFMKDARICMLNGRFDETKNNVCLCLPMALYSSVQIPFLIFRKLYIISIIHHY